MGHAAEKLEHAHHVAHSGHGGDRLSMAVGITMAILGVLLAFAAAKVGGARTELTQALVDQQHANAQFQAQDVKHRVAILSLQNLHAEAEAGRTNARDMLAMAGSAERYEREAAAALIWVDAYDPLVVSHVESQEHYERGQLAAEFGIVIASIALLLRRRSAWFLAMALGGLSVVLIATTYLQARGELHEAEEKIASSEKTFETMREANKTTDADHALIDEVRRTYGGGAPAAAPAAHP
ncbi:MAG TPA: DUF4337 family protein [Kofleriaceae bacterium]